MSLLSLTSSGAFTAVILLSSREADGLLRDPRQFPKTPSRRPSDFVSKYKATLEKMSTAVLMLETKSKAPSDYGNGSSLVTAALQDELTLLVKNAKGDPRDRGSAADLLVE